MNQENNSSPKKQNAPKKEHTAKATGTPAKPRTPKKALTPKRTPQKGESGKKENGALPSGGATTVMPDTSNLKKATKKGCETRVSTPIKADKAPKKQETPPVITPRVRIRRYKPSSAVASFVGTVVYLAAVVLISVGLSIFAIDVANEAFAFKKQGVPVDITLQGDFINVDSLADQLYDQHVIKYPAIFKIYASLRHKDDREFVAGKYKDIPPELGYDALLALFLPPVEARKEIDITIPEGYTADDIIDLCVKNGLGTKEAFTHVINTYEFDVQTYWFLEGVEPITDPENDPRIYRLEGFLYPDTYRFYDSYEDAEGDIPGTAAAKAVITKMLNQFKKNVKKSYVSAHREYMEKVYPDAPALSFYELLTLASVLEKENLADERSYSSAVFFNRLAHPEYEGIGGRLESNATVLYAIRHETGTLPTEFTDAERDYVSAYNSYTNAGLPPTPITTPTADSINAALYPATTMEGTPLTYYYFVATKSGYSFFAETFEQHQANIVRANNGEEAKSPLDVEAEDEYA
ncbi:MAG: endolytic transglycosylase MltG [Clostridia bacterium]|nr:endolytic transglycosylase MltG [Clostridia bacterium]MBQ8398388.1 endolytic transglycosylase MltG [Clostridia bacterium]